MNHTALDTHALSEEDKLRADLYGFLARLLISPPSKKILEEIRELKGDSTLLGQAFDSLARQAEAISEKSAKREYEDLFIGMGRGELLPYGSYYLTGFLNEKPLAKLRNSLRELGIEREEGVTEPEDHIGTLMEVMEGLITGKFDKAADLVEQKEFFNEHIKNWAGHFFNDLNNAENANLYKPLGTIGKMFLEIESTAFAMR